MDLITQKKIESVERLKVLLAKKKAKLAEKSLGLFIQFFLKHLTPNKTPEFHLEMIKIIEEMVLQKKNSRVLFCAPRGFAKSHLNSIFLPLWLACYSYRKDIFIVSATISLAKAHLRKIRLELENNIDLIRAFGEFKSDKWTEDYLVLNNGVEIKAKGREFQIRGFRPDFIVCDDLEDEEVIYSKEQRDKLEHWFFRTLLPALKPHQDLIYVGTKLHQFSLISKLEVKPEFVSRRYSALTNGKSIWEDLWSTEALKKIRKEIGTYAFESEYQNNPISLEDQPVKIQYLEDVKIDGKVELSCLSLDPAISEKTTSDYRAIVIIGRTPNGFIELYSDRGRWSISEQVDKIIRLYQEFRPNAVILEEVAFQKIFRKVLLDKAREKRIYIRVVPAELGMGEGKRPKDKLTRLLEVVHLFEQRLVQINNPELKDELLAFPFGDYDDMVDALVYGLYWLISRNRGLVFSKKEEFSVVPAKKSYYIKEIRPNVYVAASEPPPIRNIRNNRIISF